MLISDTPNPRDPPIVLAESPKLTGPIKLSRDTGKLAIVMEDDSVGIWDLTRQNILTAKMVEGVDDLDDLEYSPAVGTPVSFHRADYLATVNSELISKIDTAYQTASLLQKARRAFPGRQNARVSTISARSGRYVFSINESKTISLWDAAIGEPIEKKLIGHKAYITAIAVRPDERYLASVDVNNQVIFWDIERFEPVGAFNAGPVQVKDLAFSDDGTYLAALSSGDEKAVIWHAGPASWARLASRILGNHDAP